jgi:hypothetical protein
MPFQRFLMLYLAAFLVVRIIDLVAAVLHVGRSRGAGVALATAIMLVMFLRPVGNVDDNFIGLQAPPTITTKEMDAFRSAVAAADDAAPEGTAILVMGSPNTFEGNWHEQLWANLETDRVLYYEHWLWGWNDRHEGPPALEDGRCAFDNDTGNYYRCPGQAISEEYLADHGIGAVVVTGNATDYERQPPAADVAATSPLLESLGSFAMWDAYRVNAATTIATDGQANATSITIESEQVRATFDDGDGQILVRMNWFPRWSAEVNGQAVDVTRAEGGYMRIEAPPGAVDLVITYERTALDQATRILGWLGALATLAIVPVMRRPAREDR